MKKILLVIAALLLSCGLYAQNTEINRLLLHGSSTKGFIINNHDKLENLLRKYGVTLNLSAHIHKLLREGRIESVSCEIGGGRYKILLTEYTEEGNERYTLERTNIPFYAVVSIKRKEEPNRTK